MDVLKFYEEYYPRNIKRLIDSGMFRYFWKKISEVPICVRNPAERVEGEIFSTETLHSDNPYLKDYSKNLLNLGRDIVSRGMYFPFIGTYTPDKSYIIRSGKHRALSLRVLDKLSNIDKEFLFILAKYVNEDTQRFSKYIELYYLDRNNQLSTRVCKSLADARITMEGTAYPIIHYPNKLNPLPVLNDRDLFEEYINSKITESRC